MFTSHATWRPTVAIAVLVALVGAARPNAASARMHTHLKKSDPAANDTLASAPHAVRLWFTEKVELPVTAVRLTDASGVVVRLATLARPNTGEDAPIVATIEGAVHAGAYSVAWSTAAKDGHPANGKFGFVVKPAY
jgi:copper resistance protein C